MVVTSSILRHPVVSSLQNSDRLEKPFSGSALNNKSHSNYNSDFGIQKRRQPPSYNQCFGNQLHYQPHLTAATNASCKPSVNDSTNRLNVSSGSSYNKQKFDSNKINTQSILLNNDRQEQMTSATLTGFTSREPNVSFPTSSAYQQYQNTRNNNMGEYSSREECSEVGTGRQISTPNPLYYNKLSNSDSIKNRRNWQKRVICSKFLSYSKNCFIVLSFLQMLISLGLFVFAILRYNQALKAIKRNSLNDSEKNVLLLDFIKAEDYASTNREGTEIISLKVGASIFIPAILQFLAGIIALFPLHRRPPKFYMILEAILSSFAIILWMESIYLVAVELNLRNVQLESSSESVPYRECVLLVALISVDVVLIQTIVSIFAASQLASNSRTANSILDVHVNMITLILSIVCFGLSCYATSNSMMSIMDWIQPPRQELVALYTVGTKELIVCTYVTFSSFYGVTTTIHRRKSLRIGAIFTQGISLFSVLYYLLNPDRIVATTFNVQQMLRFNINKPFSAEVLLILYAFIGLLAIALLIQLSTTIINVFPFPPVDVYAAPLTFSHTSAANQNFLLPASRQFTNTCGINNSIL